MTNYIARLYQHAALVIQDKIRDGVAWEVSVFEELVMECEKQKLDRRKTRSLVLDILKMIPRLDADGRRVVWAEVSEKFLPEKEYTVTRINMETASAEELESHMAKVFAAKFKEMSL